jgi:hypothetical protein
LREGAAALATALQAVTRGPVDDQVLALPHVSHRSPLAPWKALVRAIASFYRREDDACKKWLRAIPDDSVPARLIPSLVAMVGMKSTSEFSPAEQLLMTAAGNSSAALRPVLADLEKALAAKNKQPLLEAARAAVAFCDRCCPKIVERLRQHITIRCLARGISRRVVGSAIGPPRGDAYFYRLLAQSLERDRNFDSQAEAVLVWEDFRREAIKEKWLAANSLEDGVLSLHMAQMVEHFPPDVIDDLEIEVSHHREREKQGVRQWNLFSPEALYERACRADPNSDAFQMWLNWAEKQRSWKIADNVAELWRQARVGDIRPLLYLMESAEKRGAYKKSLKYLKDAEELDRLNPDVGRAKLRLLCSATMRHLRQRNTRLAVAEIKQIGNLAEVQEGEIAALAKTLGLICAALDRDTVDMRVQNEELLKVVGGIVPAFVLTKGLIKAANLDSQVQLPPVRVSGLPAADLLGGIARACALGDWAGLPLPLPSAWERHLIDALNQPTCPVAISQLLVLGEAALRSQAEKLAYAVSVAGLATGSADSRFLFLRGRSLPQWAFQRREGCFSAALELARRERNTDLAGKILDQLRGGVSQVFGFGFQDDPDIAIRPLPPELLNQILREEQEEKQFPIPARSRPPKYGSKLGPPPCDCPTCRARRGEPVYDDEDDEDLDEDAAAVADFEETLTQFQEFLDTLPPKIARQVEEAIARGDSPQVAASRILGNLPPIPLPLAPRKEKNKVVKRPPPEQGELF